MRHALTARFVIIVLAVTLLMAALFAVIANLDPAMERTDELLGLEGDVEQGRELYMDNAARSCAACHAVPALGIESENGGPPLDAVDTDARTTIASIVEGTVGAHDAQDYADVLTDQQIADIAAWVEDVGDQ